jgi:nucleotide-binding universal stress UspA family protein
MSEKLVTLAIHTNEKAQILKSVLEEENIFVSIEEVSAQTETPVTGVRIRIKESDLSKALNVVESRNLFSYSEPETYKTDDGRKRILVPVDFSDYSLKACRAAFNLAKEMQAKVKILHVYFNPYYPTALPMAEAFAYQGKEEAEFQNILDKVNRDIKKLCNTIDEKIAAGEFPSINYSYVLKEGLPEEEIVAYAKDYKPALLVMGTRGKDQKSADLIGSVTAEVIEMTSIPVLAIPEKNQLYDFKHVRNIAFLTNFSQRDLSSFDSMMSFCKGYDIKVYMAHIENKNTDKWTLIKLEGIQSYFEKRNPGVEIDYKLISGEDIVANLDHFVKEARIDIIALTTAKRNIFTRMFRPSVSRKILFQSDTPLFVLRG